MDFRAVGAVVHQTRESLESHKEQAGIGDAELETLASNIARGVDDFMQAHQGQEFTLGQVTDAVETRLRLNGVVDQWTPEAKLEVIHEATADATERAVELLEA